MSTAALVMLGCPGDDSVPQADSSSGPDTTTGIPCAPGQQIDCTCMGGIPGVQVCLDDGSGYGQCECATEEGDGTTTTGVGSSSSTSEGTTDGSTSSGGTTENSTSSGGTTDGTTDTGSESSDSGTTGGASVCDMYVGMMPGECDLWLQDCPAGEKCMPWDDSGGSSWNATRCSPVEPMPGQVGDSCTVVGSGTSGLDDCDLGLMCWEVDPVTLVGECVALCEGCPGEPTCAGGGPTCAIANDGILPLCLPTCDPLLQNCVAGQACYSLDGVFTCFAQLVGPGAYGDPCEFINVCDPGLTCLFAASVPGCGGVGCCSEFCDLTDPAGDAQCSGFAGGQTCQPWYPMGAAPPGYEDVGVCTL